MLKKRRKKALEEGHTNNIWNRHDFVMCGLGEKSRTLAIVKHVRKCIKWSKQRIVRGYADSDIWNMYGYLQVLLPDMLEHLKNHRCGSPGYLGENYTNEDGILVNDTCHEVWDKILDRMIFLWRETDEETCSKQNPYEEEYRKALDEFRDKYGVLGKKLQTPEELEANRKRGGGGTVHFMSELPEYKEISEKYMDEESPEETMVLDWLDSRPFTTLFVCGTHENFDRLYQYPVEDWHGGKVHKIRDSVLHLMRGQVFEIEEKKIFSFGGASSHDIQGGVLEPDDPEFEKKYATLSRGYLPFRINHWSWWKQELPSEEEMEEGRQNLEKHDNKVDFIVTHSCAASTQALLGHGLYSKDYLNEYLEEIRQKCKFKKWFFGHYHDNRNVNAEEILIWEQIIRIV